MNFQEWLGVRSPVQIMDIGAACIAETPVYKIFLDAGLGHLNAFEGDSRQIAKIRETYGDRVTVYNDFVADGSAHTLYLADEASGMTSLFKPDRRALKFFNGFEHFGTVLSTEQVQTRRLDDVPGLPQIDLLKMDIQGAELSVLENGQARLKDCLAIQLEVSFVCLYENQPTFGDIDVWMRRHGYVPHTFLHVKKWSIAPTIRNDDIRQPFNQLLEADVVYIKDPLNLAALSDEQLGKLALIAHACFASYDLCVHALLEMIGRGLLPPDADQQYLAGLNPSA